MLYWRACVISIQFSESAHGLCARLKNHCKRSEPVLADLTKHTKGKWEIVRSEITLLHKLGSGMFGDVYKGITSKYMFMTITSDENSPHQFQIIYSVVY